MTTEIQTLDGQPHLVITEDTGGQAHTRVIPVQALGSWAELLGMDDTGEVLAAIVHVQDHGEPDPDPETGENAWTPAYGALMAREQTRAAEALREVDPAVEVRSTQLRTLLAAYSTTDQVDAGIDETRTRLGLPPRQVAGRMSARTMTLTADVPDDETSTALAQVAGLVATARATFLATLAPTLPEE